MMSATLTTVPDLAVVRRDSLFAGDFDYESGHANWDVTADGKGFVLIKPVNSDRQLIVVHDWKRELRARMSSMPTK